MDFSILFVEDDELVASGVMLILKRQGYSVIWANGFAAAIRAMNAPIGLLLSDFWLDAGRTACDVLDALLARRPGTPWVVLTADPISAQARMPGDGLILGKPAKAEELRVALRNAFAQTSGAPPENALPWP